MSTKRVGSRKLKERQTEVFGDEKDALRSEELEEIGVVAHDPKIAQRWSDENEDAVLRRLIEKDAKSRSKSNNSFLYKVAQGARENPSLESAQSRSQRVARSLGLTNETFKKMFDRTLGAEEKGVAPRSALLIQRELLQKQLDEVEGRLLNRDVRRAREVSDILEKHGTAQTDSDVALARLQAQFGNNFSLTRPVITGPFIEQRNAIVQKAITETANVYFSSAEVRERLVQFLNKDSFSEINFSADESIILRSLGMHDYLCQIGAGATREERGFPILQFYDFAMSMSDFWTRVHGLYKSLGVRDVDARALDIAKPEVLASDGRPWILHDAFPERETRYVQVGKRDKRTYDTFIGQSVLDTSIHDPDYRLLHPMGAIAEQKYGDNQGDAEIAFTPDKGYTREGIKAYHEALVSRFPQKTPHVRPKTNYELACQEAIFCTGIMERLLALGQGLFCCHNVRAPSFVNPVAPGQGRSDRKTFYNYEIPVEPGDYINSFTGAVIPPEKNHVSLIQPKYNVIKDYPNNFYSNIVSSVPQFRDRATSELGAREKSVEGMCVTTSATPLTPHIHTNRRDKKRGGAIGTKVFVVQRKSEVVNRTIDGAVAVGFEAKDEKTVQPTPGLSTAEAGAMSASTKFKALLIPDADGQEENKDARVRHFLPPVDATVVDFEAEVEPFMSSLIEHPIHACPKLKKAFHESGAAAVFTEALTKTLRTLIDTKIKRKRLTTGFSDPISFRDVTQEIENVPQLIASRCDPDTQRTLYFDQRGDRIPTDKAFEFDPVERKFYINPDVARTECVDRRLAPDELQPIAAEAYLRNKYPDSRRGGPDNLVQAALDFQRVRSGLASRDKIRDQEQEIRDLKKRIEIMNRNQRGQAESENKTKTGTTMESETRPIDHSDYYQEDEEEEEEESSAMAAKKLFERIRATRPPSSSL